MARRKREPMSEGKKNIIAELIEEYDIRTAKDIEDALRDLMGGTIQEMLEAELDSWKDLDQHTKTMNLANLIARDIFCCFDKNRYDENDEFAVCDRIYSIKNKDGENDFIYAEEHVKGKLLKKQLSEESKYFKQLMEFNAAGRLPKSSDE